MKINANMGALTANKNLLRVENNLATSIERLSSGYKINTAGDNPAGMAISNKMKAQIDALDQATSNSTDAQSVMQIADGALSEVSNILQRIRELSVQAANGVNSYEERESIQEEITELRKEVDRISTDTEYNSKTLLDGQSNTRVYATPNSATRIEISSSVASQDYMLDVEAAGTQAETSITIPSPMTEGSFSINDVEVNYDASMTEEEFYAAVRDAAEMGGCTAELDGSSITLTSTRYGTDATVEVAAKESSALSAIGVSGSYDGQTGTYISYTAGSDAQVSIPSNREAAGFTSSATVATDGNHVTVTDLNGFSIEFMIDQDYTKDTTSIGDPGADGNFKLEVTDIGGMTIQVGANEYQTMTLDLPEVSCQTLYLDQVDVTVTGGADRAISLLDQAIEEVSSVRSRIGAFQNRLEYAESSLSESTEDMTSAYSGLMDTDMATEMTEYTQQNVLEQAALSVLSQANDLPQTVLSLLQK